MVSTIFLLMLVLIIPGCTENSYYDYIAGNVKSSMVLEPTCENEIINTIKINHSKSSSGYEVCIF
jgi:hypothetical protein